MTVMGGHEALSPQIANGEPLVARSYMMMRMICGRGYRPTNPWKEEISEAVG